MNKNLKKSNPMILNIKLDRLGTAGLFFIAMFSPCCFPLFAFVASVLGLGSFELFGGWTMWIFQTMVFLTIAGLLVSYLKHRCIYPLLVAVPCGILIFYGYNFNNSDYWTYLLYTGMAGLLVATFWNSGRNKLHGSCNTCIDGNGKDIKLISIITCPNCGYTKTETMPTDACVYFFECESCKARLKPLEGDCCVYCSYGTMKCPPMQIGKECC